MIERLFAYANRGILLDVVVLLVNVILMTFLSSLLADRFRQAKPDVCAADGGGVLPGTFFLQPAGVAFDRLRHLRRPDRIFPSAFCFFLLIFWRSCYS